MFKRLLASTRMQLDVSAESASIGPAADGPHDARVSSVAREAGLPLPARSPRVFNELNDIVHYDLVLVMDKFDLEAVGCPAPSFPWVPVLQVGHSTQLPDLCRITVHVTTMGSLSHEAGMFTITSTPRPPWR